MQKHPIITISLINYNGRKFVFKAIESAVGQSYPNLEIIITDNNSTDGTREEIEKKISQWEEKRRNLARNYRLKPKLRNLSGARFLECNIVKYIKNNENTGFGRPHNQAIRIAKGDFVLLLNSDAILKSDYIENSLKLFNDPKVGAAQGKLLRYDFDKNELCKDKNNPKLNIIDTTGLMMFKNRRIVCIGQGQADAGQFEEEKEVFGADGAMPIYRKEALEDIKLPILESGKWKVEKEQDKKFPISNFQFPKFEYFDEDFFMYKEDVDLAWRLRLNGWKTIYMPKAIAYHGRGSGDSMAKSYIDIIRERRKINSAAKYLSSKHQRLMQIKNDFPSLLFGKHFFEFVPKEIGAWIYTAVFEGFALKLLKDIWRGALIFLEKRKMVMAKKRVGAKEMERWFN